MNLYKTSFTGHYEIKMKFLVNFYKEDAVIAIQGSLILSHRLNDFVPFQRIIKQLPEQLCQYLGA
jgi:hypothetical protein